MLCTFCSNTSFKWMTKHLLLKKLEKSRPSKAIKPNKLQTHFDWVFSWGVMRRATSHKQASFIRTMSSKQWRRFIRNVEQWLGSKAWALLHSIYWQKMMFPSVYLAANFSLLSHFLLECHDLAYIGIRFYKVISLKFLPRLVQAQSLIT